MQHRYIGQTAPHTAFSCGEQVPDVAIPHYRGRQDAALPCAVSSHTAHRVGKLRGLSRSRNAKCPVRLRERPRHFRCTLLQQKLREGYLCCSRTSAMPSTPSQKVSGTTWVDGLPTTPAEANLAAESISLTTGPGREGNKRCAGAVRMYGAC